MPDLNLWRAGWFERAYDHSQSRLDSGWVGAVLLVGSLAIAGAVARSVVGAWPWWAALPAGVGVGLVVWLCVALSAMAAVLPFAQGGSWWPALASLVGWALAASGWGPWAVLGWGAGLGAAVWAVGVLVRAGRDADLEEHRARWEEQHGGGVG